MRRPAVDGPRRRPPVCARCSLACAALGARALRPLRHAAARRHADMIGFRADPIGPCRSGAACSDRQPPPGRPDQGLLPVPPLHHRWRLPRAHDTYARVAIAFRMGIACCVQGGFCQCNEFLVPQDAQLTSATIANDARHARPPARPPGPWATVAGASGANIRPHAPTPAGRVGLDSAAHRRIPLAVLRAACSLRHGAADCAARATERPRSSGRRGAQRRGPWVG
jgi:hypothetical protein